MSRKFIYLIIALFFLSMGAVARVIEVTPAGATGMMLQIATGGTPAADVTAPTVSGNPVIDTDGDTVTIAFTETVSTNNYDTGDFDIDCDGASGANNNLAYSSGDDSSSVVFTTTSTVQSGETCNLDYTGGADEIEDTSGNDLAQFSDDAMTNNSTQGGSEPDYTDDFAGVDLSAWDQLTNSYTLDTGADNVYGPIGDNPAAMSYGTNTAGVTQYVSFNCGDASTGCGAAFRSTGTGTDGFYTVYWYGGTTWYWERWSNVGYTHDADSTASCGPSNGERVGITIQGTGNDTIVKIWNTPTNNYPYDVDNWDNASDAADCTLTGNPGSAEDTGLRVGFAQFNDSTMDNFTGGSFD